MPNRGTRKKQYYRRKEELRQERKYDKRNRKKDRVRRKSWIPASSDDWDEMADVPASERIMPRGERERRRAVPAEALATLGVQAEDGRRRAAPQPSGQQGIVVEVSSGLCRVEVDGREWVCRIRGSLSAQETGFTNVVAVGDWVVVSQNGSRQGVVEVVLPRRGVLARPDVFYSHLQQVIAANVDQLLIVAAWREPHFWPELVDRYLITAERNNLAPIVCVNKVDLADDVALCRAEVQPYLDLDYHVLFTSAQTRKGVGRLRKALSGRTTVLAGMSGVGKSSLLEVVQPGLGLRTAAVSERSGEGRHTTAQVNLLRLDGGGAVIDTPGIREFALSNLLPAELVRFYPELAAVARRCGFANCSHTHEPGCAVKAAVERGAVSAMRYHSYKKIYDDLGARAG